MMFSSTKTSTRHKGNALSYAAIPTLISLTIVGLLVGFPQFAKAQGVFNMGMLTNTLSQDTVVSSERGRGQKSNNRKTSLKSALTRSRSAKTGKTTQVAFTPSPAVRKKSIAGFLSRMRAVDPQLASSLEKEFATKDIFGELARKLATYDLKTNSVTDAFTLYTVVAWQGVRGNNDDPSKSHVRGVREQMSHVFTEIPSLTSATDTKKQELADAFILQALLIDICVAGAKKHPEQMSQVKSALAMGTKATLGFDLTTFKLTDKGLSL
jgi:hypothetical protein